MKKWDKRHRLLARWTVASGVVALGTITWSLAGRSTGSEMVVPGAAVEGLTSILSRDAATGSSTIRFQDVTRQFGIRFHHFPVERASQLPEDMGSGVAVGDYDGDGFPDIFFVNFSGNVLPGSPMNARDGCAKLYHNVNGDHFEDVTNGAGVGFVGFGMGAAWGDYDNDGDLDLYVTALGANVLYENLGQGGFRDVTKKTGVQDRRFSAGCAWADYDRDGDLDLYVCNYVDFIYRASDRNVILQQYSTEQPYTINPSAYSPVANSLFRNNGDGTFEEVAADVGVADPTGRSLSASWVDLDNNGWLDLYVANDVSNNGVFRNAGDGRFEDVGASSLAADYRGAMGIAVSDFDNDLDEDLLVTHWIAQENALFRNMVIDNMVGRDQPSAGGRLWLMDEADQNGLGQISLDMVGWATGFCDFDNDGLRDLWVVNGSTLEESSNHRLLTPQAPFVFLNRGKRGFVNVAEASRDALAKPIVGRGGAQLDFDEDGRVDWVILVHGGQAKLLKNTSNPVGHYLRVLLHQQGGNTSALGARAYVTAAGNTQMAVVGSGSSYLSQNESTLHFGLGSVAHVDSLRLVWPDGMEEVHHDLPADRTVSFRHTFRRAATPRSPAGNGQATPLNEPAP